MFNFIFLIFGILAGVLGTYFIAKGKFGLGKVEITTIHSHTVVDRIERVFKVVTAEGHYAEIFDYSNTSHLLTFIPSTKKALLIVNAKVLMGYDFKKMKMEIDEVNHKISIVSFPTPEILSIKPEMKYYNLDNGIFNKFDNHDLTKLQQAAKVKIKESVAKSDLASIAQHQLQTMLIEIAALSQFQIEGIEQINSVGANYIESPQQ